MIGAPENDELVVVTGGRKLSGWTAVRVDRGVELLPSSFSVQLTERYPGEASVAVVDPGSTCEVYLGQDKILTGYIDLYWPHIDAGRHVVSIQGRSKTEDLVDCSLTEPTVPPWSIKPTSLKQIAELVCKPFGIGVSLPDGDISFDSTTPDFIIQPGETCAQLLEEVSRRAQVLMSDDAEGRLVLSRLATKRAQTALVEGVNCEIAETRLSMDKRYSHIQVIATAPIGPLSTGDTYHLNKWYTARDDKVPRYRPKLIIMDATGPSDDWPKRRAEWEKARRYGRSRLVEIVATGWRQGDGTLWQPNTIAAVSLPSLKMVEDVAVAAVGWVRGQRGTQTFLTLMPKEGLQPAPILRDSIPGYRRNAQGQAADLPSTDQIVAKGGT